MGQGHDNKLQVFFMGDNHEVLRENVLLVGSPKYKKTGVDLEYYEDKSN
jgi:hypothetical protein